MRLARTLACAVLLLGCERGAKQGSQDGASNSAVASASSAALAASASAPTPVTEEDFEEEAERLINADSLEAELDALGKEIRQK